MAFRLICPNLQCRKVLQATDEQRGQVVRCQHCQTMLRVPPVRKPSPAEPLPLSRVTPHAA